jgi:hypothetical protein
MEVRSIMTGGWEVMHWRLRLQGHRLDQKSTDNNCLKVRFKKFVKIL